MPAKIKSNPNICYINRLGKQYNKIVKKLPNVMREINKNKQLRDTLLKFSALQDYQYSHENILNVEEALKHIQKNLTGSQIDDLLEILLLSQTKICENNNYYNVFMNDDLFHAIHDAWSISRLVTVDENNDFKLIPFTEQTDNNKDGREKEQIPIPTSFLCEEKGKNEKAILQKRRLSQLKEFNLIDKNEQNKDVVPLKTFFFICLENYDEVKGISNLMHKTK